MEWNTPGYNSHEVTDATVSLEAAKSYLTWMIHQLDGLRGAYVDNIVEIGQRFPVLQPICAALAAALVAFRKVNLTADAETLRDALAKIEAELAAL